MPSQRSFRLRRMSASTVVMTLLVVVLLMAAPATVMADGNTDDTTSVPVTAGPMGPGPAVPPVINASFTSSFVNVTQGHTLDLAWSPIDTKYEPLSITARAINRTAGNRANSFLVTITPHLTNTSTFSWTMVPFPLQFMSTGIYEVEIRPAIWNLSANEPGSLTVPVLARSSFFTISEDGSAAAGGREGGGSTGKTGSSAGDPSGLVYGQSESATSASSSTHKRLAFGLGISLGLSGALALAGILYAFRRRHLRRAAEAQRQRQKRKDFLVE